MGQAPSTNKIVIQPKESVNIVLTDEVFNRLTKDPVTMMDSRLDSERDRSGVHSTVSKDQDVGVENIEAIADQESEFTHNKNYWKKRLEDLQAGHEKIKMVLETEYERGFKDVQGTLINGKVGKGKEERPCVENMGEVVKCYKSNSGEPLNCDKQVNNFVSCLKTKITEKYSPESESTEQKT